MAVWPFGLLFSRLRIIAPLDCSSGLKASYTLFAAAKTSRPSSRRTSFVASASEEESASVAVEEESDAAPFTHGEWSSTHSILNFEDVMAHYEPMMFKENVSIAAPVMKLF